MAGVYCLLKYESYRGVPFEHFDLSISCRARAGAVCVACRRCVVESDIICVPEKLMRAQRRSALLLKVI